MRARRVILLASLLGGALVLPGAPAQRGGGGPGGGMGSGGMRGGGFPGGPGVGDMGHQRPYGGGPGGPMRGGLLLGPPGRWWDDKHFAKDLKLRPDQQHRMDGIFEENRPTLFRRLETLHSEEDRMQTLVHTRPVDENAVFMQIDRLEQARADLEKASAHFMLQIRGEMDLDQISRLEQHP